MLTYAAGDWQARAQAGKDMPWGLPLLEQLAYMRLLELSRLQARKSITQQEKQDMTQKVLGAYQREKERMAFGITCQQRSIQLWKDIEAAVRDYQKAPSKRAADRLVAIIYGLRPT